MATTKRLDKDGVAEHYGIAVRTVARWRERGLPALKRRGMHGRLLFDIEKVDTWLAAQGIVPGRRGSEGGAARQQGADSTEQPAESSQKKRRKVKKLEGGPPSAHGAEGLGAALKRLERMERILGERLAEAMGSTDAAGKTETQGAIKTHQMVVDELRKVTAGLLELEVARGKLVPRDDFRDSVAHLAAVFRSAVERLADELPPRVVGALGRAGIEVSDMGALQRAMKEEVQKRTDDWLRTLSDAVRKGAS